MCCTAIFFKVSTGNDGHATHRSTEQRLGDTQSEWVVRSRAEKVNIRPEHVQSPPVASTIVVDAFVAFDRLGGPIRVPGRVDP